MIIQEIITIDNKEFTHTYSSDNKFIKQVETGAIYDQAFDTQKRHFNYIETDIVLPKEEFPEI